MANPRILAILREEGFEPPKVGVLKAPLCDASLAEISEKEKNYFRLFQQPISEVLRYLESNHGLDSSMPRARL